MSKEFFETNAAEQSLIMHGRTYMKKKSIRQWVLFMVAIMGCLIMAGCEQKTINDIKADPSLYANKEVAITGTVTRSVSLLGKGAYEIEDGTGKLWVVSKSGVPREGAKIIVKGKIQDGFNLGALVKLPEPISSGLVMIESAHKAR
jgi:hypothetical protein